MILLEGKKIADQILKDIKKKLGTLTHPPTLAFILIGSNPASQAYVRIKKKKCQEVGIISQDTPFPEDVSEKRLLAHIDSLNENSSINGILVQQPLPKHLSLSAILEAVNPKKMLMVFTL